MPHSAQIFYDMDEATYRADPCEKPSLTQTHAKLILDRSPAHVFVAHPRLNPEFVADDDTKFDLGSVAHRILIGRGKEIEALPFDNWQTKAAKEARAEAKARGVLAVLESQYSRAEDMAGTALEQLEDSDWPGAFIAGHGEVVITWREGDVHFRTMIDWMESEVSIYDYKSTSFSCSPYDIAERPSMMGWDIQAAFYDRGLDALDMAFAGKRNFVYIAQEDEPPYALSIVKISEGDLTMGRKKLAMAAELWDNCMRLGRWPAYPLQTITSRPKAWIEAKTLEREIEHEERKSLNPEILNAG